MSEQHSHRPLLRPYRTIPVGKHAEVLWCLTNTWQKHDAIQSPLTRKALIPRIRRFLNKQLGFVFFFGKRATSFWKPSKRKSTHSQASLQYFCGATFNSRRTQHPVNRPPTWIHRGNPPIYPIHFAPTRFYQPSISRPKRILASPLPHSSLHLESRSSPAPPLSPPQRLSRSAEPRLTHPTRTHAGTRTWHSSSRATCPTSTTRSAASKIMCGPSSPATRRDYPCTRTNRRATGPGAR